MLEEFFTIDGFPIAPNAALSEKTTFTNSCSYTFDEVFAEPQRPISAGWYANDNGIFLRCGRDLHPTLYPTFLTTPPSSYLSGEWEIVDGIAGEKAIRTKYSDYQKLVWMQTDYCDIDLNKGFRFRLIARVPGYVGTIEEYPGIYIHIYGKGEDKPFAHMSIILRGNDAVVNANDKDSTIYSNLLLLDECWHAFDLIKNGAKNWSFLIDGDLVSSSSHDFDDISHPFMQLYMHTHSENVSLDIQELSVIKYGV